MEMTKRVGARRKRGRAAVDRVTKYCIQSTTMADIAVSFQGYPSGHELLSERKRGYQYTRWYMLVKTGQKTTERDGKNAGGARISK